MRPSEETDATVATRDLLVKWRDDAGGTYRTWFLWEERLKNFRSIRRGLATVIDEIEREAREEGASPGP